MSDKLYFPPLIGYRLTRLGLAEATDNWNNAWSGFSVSCANRDPSVSGLREAPFTVTPSELLTIGGSTHMIGNPGNIPNIPKNAASMIFTGVYDLGDMQSPLQTICNARRDQEGRGR